MSELAVTDATIKSPAKIRSDRWLGIMSCFAIAWYIMGFVGFIFTFSMTADMAMKLYSAEQLDYLRSTHIFVNIANAVFLGAGLVGSVYMLLRRKSAYMWYMASLFAILLTLMDAALRGGFDIMGSTHWGVSIVMIILGVYLFWAAYDARDSRQIA